MSSSFKVRFARVAPVRVLDRVRSGSPAVLTIRPVPDLADVKTVTACLSLARRGTGLATAKCAVEAAIETGRAQVELPTVEDLSALFSELRDSGILASEALEDMIPSA